MSTWEMIAEKVRELPQEKQDRVLQIVESMRAEQPRHPLRSLRGLWKDLGVDITSDDIAAARREMWGNFPRDDI